MKLWLFRVLVASAIGAYVYYTRQPPEGDPPLLASGGAPGRVVP